MKAIDFSCNLLKTLGESKLSNAEARLLFCVAAGLHYKSEIESYLQPYSSGACFTTLNRLVEQGLVNSIGSEEPVYTLSAKGRELVAHLLRFLPHHPNT